METWCQKPTAGITIQPEIHPVAPCVKTSWSQKGNKNATHPGTFSGMGGGFIDSRVFMKRPLIDQRVRLVSQEIGCWILRVRIYQASQTVIARAM
jgi:hypothetical protein